MAHKAGVQDGPVFFLVDEGGHVVLGEDVMERLGRLEEMVYHIKAQVDVLVVQLLEMPEVEEEPVAK